PRPETGFGPMSNLTVGETAVLTRPEAVDGHSLAGAGATGKTQLAVAFAHSIWQSGSADLLVWVPAASRDAIIAGYAQALGEIGASDTGDDQDTVANRFVASQQHHRDPDARRAMAVFISSIDTGLFRFRLNNPFSYCHELVAATMAN